MDSDNEDDETKFVDDDDEDKITASVVKMENDDEDEEDELDKFMAGIEVHVKLSPCNKKVEEEKLWGNFLIFQ